MVVEKGIKSELVKTIREQVIGEVKTSTQIEDWFLDEHLLVVEHLAGELCEVHPEADEEIVMLGVWLHDRERVFGMDEGHDVVGADNGRELLLKMGYDSEKAQRVWEVCRAHGVKDVVPVSIEAKILATADAMSHFEGNFYKRVFEYFRGKMDVGEAKMKVGKKIQRDYNDKIFFGGARESVKAAYESWRQLFPIQE